jgi:hypothetical protein
MKKKFKKKDMEKCCNSRFHSSCNSYGSCGGCTYGLGFIGAAIYYISTAGGFWMGVLGVLKAIVWPAFLIFEVLKFLGM